MKRVAILSALIAVGGLYGGAHAADGTITFKGSLTAAPCSIDSASTSQIIDFGVVSISSFGAIGSTSASKPFDIKLTGCDTATYKTAAVRFAGTAASNSSELLSTDNDGLAIELTDTAGTRLKLGDTSTYQTLNPQTSTTTGTPPNTTTTNNKDGSGVLSFRARYSAVKAAADMKAGPANAVASFTVNYK